jgi:hypothetical protein
MEYCPQIRNNDTTRMAKLTKATGKVRAINGAL